MTPLQSLKQNIDAINELINSIKENRKKNSDIIDKFVGFGNIKEILFDPADPTQWKGKDSLRDGVIKLRTILKNTLGEDMYEHALMQLQSSTLTSYYTPREVVNPIVTAFSNYAEQSNIKLDVLDPSCGSGAFVTPMLNDSNFKSITALEKDPLTAWILLNTHNHSKIECYNKPLERLTTTPEHSKRKYDLIISNIPFGNYKVHDSDFNKLPNSSIQNKSMSTIHGYFFMKSIELLEPNGHLAFITSTGISDSASNNELRREMIRKCELVNAVRLPNHTFDNAGTKVVSDLIIVKRREKTLTTLNDVTEKEKQYLTTQKVTFPNPNGEDINQNINSFFITDGESNENVLGKFQAGMFYDSPVITIESQDNLEVIASRISELISIESPVKEIIDESEPVQEDLFGQLSLFGEVNQTITKQYNSKPNPASPKAPDVIKLDYQKLEDANLTEGNIFISNDTLGKIEFTSKGPILQPLLSKYNQDKIRLSFQILHTYKQLVESINLKQPEDVLSDLRKSLNSDYDKFRNKYGSYHERKNIDVVELDIEGFKLKGLEIINEHSVVVKSDIFHSTPTVDKEPITLKDAVMSSLNVHGKIVPKFISEETGIEETEAIKKALEEQLIFINPNTRSSFDTTKSYTPNEVESHYYVTKDELISGSVRFKKIELEKHFATYELANEDIIQNTINLLEQADIPIVSIQELDAKLGESWVPKHHYENFAREFLNLNVKLSQSHSNSSYSIDASGYSYENTNQYSVRCKNNRTYRGTDLFIYAMHGNTPRITYSVKYSDGSSQKFIDREAMSDMSMKVNKINLAWKDYLIRNEEVGKELEFIYNNTQNVEVERHFSGEHLTFPGLTTFDPYEHQRSGVWQNIIQNGGLIDHEVGAGKTLLMACQAIEMKRLGVANKTIIVALKANTKAIYQDFKTAYPTAKVLFPLDKEFTPANRVQFFQKIQNNNWDAIIMTHDQFAKIPQSREIQDKIIKDELENLQLDLKEAQNEGRASQDRRVMKGLQKRIENKEAALQKLSESLEKDPHLLTFDKMGIEHLIVDESQQFKNLEFTSRHNRVAGLGSPEGSARALNMLMAVRTMQSIHGADKGVTFCSGTPISNSLIELYLLKKYLRPTELQERKMKNFDSWARSYAELSRDFEIGVTNEVKPKERFRSFNKVPELARFYRSFTNVANQNNLKIDKPKLDTHLVEIENTELQKQYSKELVKAIQTENFSFFGLKYSEEQLSAKMLLATGISSKVAMDMRLLDPSREINDGSKLIQSARNIAKHYNDSQDFKGTQLVFCDTGTPKGKAHDEQHFNLYTELKNHLVSEYNIPEHEIQFIHYHDSKTARKKLQDQVNNGKVRIVLGSTTKMGVGVNMQQKVVAMHHLDIPWRPSDFTQRNGRGERQGNLAAKKFCNNKVANYIYATKGTLDAYKYFLVDLKQKFIDQIKKSNITSRTIDEGDMDEGSMSPAAFIAQLSGKKELLEKNKIDKRLQDVELQKRVVQQQKAKIEKDINYADKTIPLIEARKQKLNLDLTQRNKIINANAENMYQLVLPSGDIIKSKEEITDHLVNEVSFARENKSLGTIGDFELSLSHYQDISEKTPTSYVQLSLISKQTEIEYTFGTGTVNPEREGNLYRYPVDALKSLEDKIESQSREYKRLSEEKSNNEKLAPTIDTNQFDELISELNQQSHELALIIENDEANIEESLKTTETIIQHILDRNYTQCKDFINSLPENQVPNIEELIDSSNQLDESMKTEARVKLISPQNNNDRSI